MDLLDARRLSPEAQEALRRRVFAAVEAGMSQAQAARTFQVSRQSVNSWMKAVRKEGPEALVSGKRGRPKGGTLTKAEQGRISRLVLDRCPDQLKLPFYLWTREAIAELVEKRCGKSLSVWTVGRYLKSWGMTPQKPARRAFERDPEAVQRWLDKEYPALRQRAHREKATICWGDEMGLRSDHQTGTTWGLRGQTPLIPGTGKRFRCNMISAISNRGHLAFMVFSVRFTWRVFLDFLRRLVKQARGKKTFLIIDGHPVHRAVRVKMWVEAHKDSIELFALPSYSPELNPDEVLNQDVKSNALGRRRPEDQQEMVADLRGYLRSRQKKPQIIRNYFQEEHVRYAAS